jgi:hypothetical protein
MANVMIKAERIVSVGLGLLERELTIPSLVWRNAGGDFAGAKDDTISLRLPAYATARTRALRSGSTRTRDSLAERKVDITLDTDIYKDIRITDEELTLDIESFGTQVLNPVVAAIARKAEDLIVTEMTGATYEHTLEFSNADPYATAVAARAKLNDSFVPLSGRAMVVGSSLESAFLLSDRFVRADAIGPSAATAVRESMIGRVAGFDVYTSPAIAPDEGYAFHKSAYVMSTRAPVVPAGAPYGASASSEGFSIRVVRVLDSETIEDILATDLWVGTNVVTDNGAITNGRFEPSEDPTDSGASDLFVRAVKIVDASSL